MKGSDLLRIVDQMQHEKNIDREIKAIAREAGYRTKIAVSSVDLKVDCVGACVGVRGSRIKNVVEELNGEGIEIMTLDALNEGIERAEHWFRQIPGITDELLEAFITEGFLSFDDLTFLEPAEMAELGGID